MADNKRNVTGSYPGSGGAPKPKKPATPFGSYPGKKPAMKIAPKEAPKKEEPAAPVQPPQKEEPPKQETRPEKESRPKRKPSSGKRFKFSALFSAETLNKYWKTLVYYAAILVVSVALAAWICHVGNEVLALIRPDKEVTVTVEDKNSVKQIAKAMKKAGVIDHPGVFNLYCKLKKEGNFGKGEYTLNSNQDYNQLIRSLKRSNANKTPVSFTIEPGDTQEDVVVTLCDSLGYLDREELENVLQNYDFSEYSFLKNLPKRNYRLEGYLCPGTYEMYEGESALAVVQRMLDRFREQFLTEENNKKIKISKYTLDEIVTMASLIQKEAGGSYPKAASVYINRLNSDFPYLESQATVHYVMPAGHGAITATDIRTNDPYNTYREQGLPPGPIANPGVEAIAAVLAPEQTADLYFVTQGDGTVLFAADAAAHAANCKKAGAGARGTGTVS